MVVLLALAVASVPRQDAATASEALDPLQVNEGLKPATITLRAEAGEIGIEGDFADGTARRLRVILRANPSIRILGLTSEGGLVDEAEQIGDIVAAHRITTVVRTQCVSACTLAYVRGRERLAQNDSKLGFHAPWIEAAGGGEEQVASDDERQAYVAAGIAADFVTEALAVPASSIWFPDDARLLAAGVVTLLLPSDGLAERLAEIAQPTRLAAAE